MAYVQKSTADNFTATERIWLTADRERVVPDGSAEAAFLLANEGSEIPAAEAERLGLAGRKAAAKPEDKQAEAPENKGVTVNRK